MSKVPIASVFPDHNRIRFHYNGGNCYLTGFDKARAVFIEYEGRALFELYNSIDFILISKLNKLIISPLNSKKVYLTDLFKYTGLFKIKSVQIVDENGVKIPISINIYSHLSENLNSQSESMTFYSEDYNENYLYENENTNINRQLYLNNLHSSDFNGDLVLKRGQIYNGYYNIELHTGIMRTGKTKSITSHILKSSNSILSKLEIASAKMQKANFNTIKNMMTMSNRERRAYIKKEDGSFRSRRARFNRSKNGL